MLLTTIHQPASIRYRNTRRSGAVQRVCDFVCSVLILFVFAVPVALGQTSGSATLRGTVKDVSGAVVPEADVTLIGEGTGIERKATTNDEGTYVFATVDPGRYTLRVERASFKTYVQPELVLSPSDTRGVDAVLQVGEASETVTVSADALTTIQTETGEKSNTITAAQIQNLSLVGRNSLELLRILPGVVAPDATDLLVTSFNTGSNATAAYIVNGQRGGNNNVSLDGSRVLDISTNNGTVITLNNDMVQEVKVQTSNYAAEFGSSGVQITGTTRSGSNEFHGGLYYYARPYQLQANERARNLLGFNDDGSRASPRPKSKFSYPGGNIGGPIYLPRFGEGGPALYSGKNKFFFFFGYEVQRQLQDAGIKRGVVPTLLQRQGDFSEFLPGGIYGTRANGDFNPINLFQSGAVRIPGLPGSVAGAGSVAPGNNLAPYSDPTGRVLLSLYPLPNITPTADNNYNYFASVVQPVNRIDSKARFDYNISEKFSGYLRLARESELQSSAFGLNNTSTFELPSQTQGTNLGRSVAFNVTSVFNPTMTNELIISASQLKLDYNYEASDKVNLTALGIDNFQLPFGRQTNAPPAIYGWGQRPQQENLWSGISNPIVAFTTNYSVTDNLTKVAGSHTLKFGGLLERIDMTRNTQDDGAGALVLGGPWNQNATGNDFGDLLVGRPVALFNSTISPTAEFRATNIEGYIQDAWKVHPNFTLEYGARIAYFPNVYERNGLGTLFDPSRYVRGAGPFIDGDLDRPNAVVSARSGEIPKQVLPNHAPFISPRLGFAWDIGGRGDLVLRGGAGIFYNRLASINIINPSLFGPPFGQRKAVINVFDGARFFSDNVNDLQIARFGLLDFVSRVAPFQIDSPDPDSNTVPRTATMSMSVAKRLPFGNVLEVAYVGTLGRHLFNFKRINIIQPGTLLSGSITDPGSGGAPGSPGYRPPAQLDLSDPVQRAALDAVTLNRFRPYPDLENIRLIQNTATSSYHSMQATLNRQLGKDLQYFVTYTFSKVLGTLSEESGGEVDPIDTRGRSYGVLNFDRTHIVNVSYNYNLPDGARGGFSNFLTRGLLNGWQASGISTYQSGVPIRPRFTGGGINATTTSLAYFGSDAFNGGSGGSGGIAPIFLRNPVISNNGNLGDRLLDINAFGIPALEQTGPTITPFYIRSPNRTNHDISFLKNFRFDSDGTKRLQFRAGFFNIFNQAYPFPGDINLALDTECVGTVSGIRNGSGGIANNICDPGGGFRFTPNTIENFGKVTTKRGRRIVEVALKFYF